MKISTKARFFWEEKESRIIYTNPFDYAIISIFQAFTVCYLENETFKHLYCGERRTETSWPHMVAAKGQEKKKTSQQRMKSKPWVTAEGILLSRM